MTEGTAPAGRHAYVLHRRRWRESSLLVELFDAEAGRVGLVARGARRSRRAGPARCEPFVELEVHWRARGDLGQLHSAEPLEGPASLPPGPSLYSGFYINELLLRLLRRHDPHPELYVGYRAALHGLAGGATIEPVLRRFERDLLEATGYGLQLHRDAASGAPIATEAWYRYEPERGPMPVAGPEGDGLRVSGRALRALADDALDTPDLLAECKRLLRAALAPHLGGRPLRSRELFARHRVRCDA